VFLCSYNIGCYDWYLSTWNTAPSTQTNYGCTALCWISAAFSVPWSYTQSVGLLRRGSARRKAATYTQNNTNTEYKHTGIHALIEIRIHDPSFRANEDGSCLRLRGHCDRPIVHNAFMKVEHFISGTSSKIFLISTASRSLLGPTRPPNKWVTGAISLG
jgi:hypothetical protein